MRRIPATFEVQFFGAGVSPELLPLHVLAETLRNVQRLASGSEPDDEEAEDEKSTISLVDVRKGSAIYPCIARRPEFAVNNLIRVGRLLASEDVDLEPEQQYALRPIERLSHIAKSLKCEIALRIHGDDQIPMAIFRPESYETLARSVLLTGVTSINGSVERVGGATKIRCTLRVEGRPKLLYCDVSNREVSQRLGQKLYEEVVATGTATWIHKTWTLIAFTITGFYQPKLGSLAEAQGALRKAGGSAWDDIEDPQAFIEGLRQ